MKTDWIEASRMASPAGSVAPMQQHPTYGAACSALGARAVAFTVPGPDGAPRAAAQVLVRRVPLIGEAALLSRGPVWAPELPDAWRRVAFLDLLAQLRQRYRIVVTTPDPVGGADPLASAGWLAAMTPCHLARLDLGPPPEVQRARQRGKWRNRLVRAEAAGLRVQHGPMPADPAHWLFRAEEAQARERRYRRLPTAFTLEWIRAGGAPAARLFTALRGSVPVAAMLFLLHGAGATYHIGWSGPEGRASGAHNLLLWRAQLWLRDRGIRQLDLDLVDTRTAPGLARFKIGSGAEVVALGATRLAAPLSGIFARHQGCGRDAGAATGRFSRPA